MLFGIMLSASKIFVENLSQWVGMSLNVPNSWSCAVCIVASFCLVWHMFGRCAKSRSKCRSNSDVNAGNIPIHITYMCVCICIHLIILDNLVKLSSNFF